MNTENRNGCKQTQQKQQKQQKPHDWIQKKEVLDARNEVWYKRYQQTSDDTAAIHGKF